ncbi:MAG TPA: alpha/beta hydrolase [Gemmatimonadaceae bacterium]|jgi:pimeloyl-ACP methyl ester carboxylesterase
MKRMLSFLTAAILLSAGVLPAQSLVGNWQGTLGAPPNALRIVLRIARADGGGLSASLLSIDQGGWDNPFSADSVVLRDSTFAFFMSDLDATYRGTLKGRGSDIRGEWIQGNAPRRLDFVRPSASAAWRDTSPHSQRLVSVERNVQLEVLDWGGSGRPVVFLAGAGNSAHIFDEFAPKLTHEYHVYGITRRGFGNSSHPASGYLADTLANDVLAVIDSLGIRAPVLIGHSIAGEELSSIGSRHPERVAGLVYLDAGYPYAIYDSTSSDVDMMNAEVSLSDVGHKLARLADPYLSMSPRDQEALIRELLETSLPQMERDLRGKAKQLAALPNQGATPPAQHPNPILRALLGGEEKYTSVHAPVLAIFAAPHEASPAVAKDSAARANADSAELAWIMPQIAAFRRGAPTARVVVLPNANHYVFKSNEAQVLRDIRAFVDGLSQPTPTGQR